MMLKEIQKGTGVLWRRVGRLAALFVAVPLAVLTFGVTPAQAANVVNYTFHVPASVQTNPCFPADVVNLSGDIHVVITSTVARNGSYKITNHLDSQLSGVSITTRTKYVNSENQDDEWYARPPFPEVHSQTYDFVLLSQSKTPNYVLHMTMHETVTANGVPTAVVDKYSMDCQG
jgi:hypothetical protein